MTAVFFWSVWKPAITDIDLLNQFYCFFCRPFRLRCRDWLTSSRILNHTGENIFQLLDNFCRWRPRRKIMPGFADVMSLLILCQWIRSAVIFELVKTAWLNWYWVHEWRAAADLLGIRIGGVIHFWYPDRSRDFSDWCVTCKWELVSFKIYRGKVFLNSSICDWKTSGIVHAAGSEGCLVEMCRWKSSARSRTARF